MSIVTLTMIHIAFLLQVHFQLQVSQKLHHQAGWNFLPNIKQLYTPWKNQIKIAMFLMLFCSSTSSIV